MTHEAAGAGIVFCMGLVFLGIGLMVPSRRSYLFGGIAVVAFGLAMPALSPATIPFAGAALAIVVGLGGAALLWWQTQADSARAKDKPRESEVIKAHP